MAESTFEHLAEIDQDLIKNKLITQLLQNSIPTLIASQGVAFVAWWVLKSDFHVVIINAWISLFVFVSIIRISNILVMKHVFGPGKEKKIAREYQRGAFLGGLCWALLICSYDATAPLFSQLFLLVTLVAMPAASLATNAVYFPVFLAFGIPIMLSMVGWSVFYCPRYQVQFALLAFMYSFLIIYIARKYSFTLKNNIESEEKNQILIREIKAVNTKLHKLAYKDPLTNLSNRRQFEKNAERLMQQLESLSISLVLMLFDVDNFKIVNDTYGHEEGDKLLQKISSRIKSSSRQSELIAQARAEVARLGGDEFVVLYHLNSADAGVNKLAQRLLHDISKPFPLGNTIFKPSVSIGIALAPQHATQIKQLLRIADAAMYQAKKAGGAQFVIANNEYGE